MSQTVSSAPISVAAATAPTVVPALVAYSGTALNAEGNPLSGEVSITFLIFKDQTGGEPLFAETRTVTLDPNGHYKVNLGATLANGLPSDLFLARNKARLPALIAVARKLLHAIYGIFRSGLKYEGTKLFPRVTLS